jgi:hypothetical protein
MKPVAALLVFACSASAASPEPTHTFTRSGPDAWQDGTPLDPVADISEWRLYCRLDVEGASFDFSSPAAVFPGFSADTQLTIDKAAVLSAVTAGGGGSYGTYTCGLAAVGQPGGLESEVSNRRLVVWEAPPPVRPGRPRLD